MSSDPAYSSLHVRAMVRGDEAGLVALFQEMQAYYRVPCPPEDVILADLRSMPEGVTFVLAFDPGVVGVATLGAIYPGPGLRPGLFLKDLFVTTSRRGAGIGKALMRGAAHFAIERGLGRIDWTADRGNAPLLAFYRGLGAIEQEEKLFFRFSGDALQALAKED